MPAGTLRFGLATRFAWADDQFNPSRQPLGAPYSGLIGPATFPALTSTQDDVRATSGVNAFTLSLGAARADIRRSTSIVPIEATLGVTSRISLHVFAPFYTAEQEAEWTLDGAGATVGVNPAIASGTAAGTDAALLSALDTAAAGLERLADGCAANGASDPRCAQITAEMAAVRSLIDGSRSTTDALARIYGGRSGTTPGPFVPLAGSAADSGIAARIAALRDAYTRYGVASVSDGARPAGAGPPPSITDLRALLSDSTYGYALGPVARHYRQGVGDIDVGVMVVVFDGLHSTDRWRRLPAAFPAFREALGFTYRLGTGSPPDPDDPLKPPTGDGQNDLEFVSATDAMLSPRWWGSLTIRWTVQQARDGIARIPDGSGSPFLPLTRRREARTELGDRLEITAMPRWIVNDYIAAGIGWRWTHQAGLRVTELAPFAGPTPMSYAGPATSLNEYTIGFTWSWISAWQRHRAKWPLEIAWEHAGAVTGTGTVPASTSDRISFRAYVRLWGR